MKPLGAKPAEKAVVLLVFGEMCANDTKCHELAKALGMSTATLHRRKKDPDTFTLGELKAASRFLHIPIEDMRSAIFK